MHLNVLNKNQHEQLDFLKPFKKSFVLVGGTAIAMHIGHRKSIDFDLFKSSPINHQKIKNQLTELGLNYHIMYEDADGIHFLVDGVKWTFFYYPFDIKQFTQNEKYFRCPDLLTLAAMKAYAIGRRSKWKDYVDIYFILKNHFTYDEICERADNIFGSAFSKKMFKIQLSYFEDIDYSEEIEWTTTKVEDDKIQKELKKISLSI